MNEIVTQTLNARRELKKRFDEKGVEGVFKEISGNSQRKATAILGEGSVLLQKGKFHTEGELRQKIDKPDFWD